jgi:ferredoxin like protein
MYQSAHTILSTEELQRLLAEDAPYGDLTTETLGIGSRDGTIRFAARQAMTVGALYQNRYLVDSGKVHIKVRPHTEPTAPLLALLTACPARCYELNDKGQVEITADGCVECGTCRVIGEASGDIEWNYPRGGYGVSFKFG